MIVSMLAVTVVLAISGWFVLERQRVVASTEISKRIPEIARVVSIALTNGVLGFDYHGIQQILDETVVIDSIIHIKVENAKAVTMAEAGSRPRTTIDLVVVRQPILYEGVSVGQLEITASTRAVTERLEREFRYLTRNMALAIAIVFAVEFIAIGWYFIRPMRRLGATLRIGVKENGEVTVPAGPYAKDEFGELESHFAAMCETVNESSRKAQSRMVAAEERLLDANQKLTRQALELKVKNEELQALSLTDPLTGLYNRRQFENFIEAELSLALRHGEDLSLLMLDLDHFKRINDTYGHAAGDQVLKQVAQIMRSAVRKSDVLCRIGGEEFVVLGKHLKRVDALAVAEKIRSAIEKTEYEADGQRFKVTISIGVASVPSPVDMRTAVDFFKCADQALYYCKQRGRNQVAHSLDVASRVETVDQTGPVPVRDTAQPSL